jgi:hypothetical protein
VIPEHDDCIAPKCITFERHMSTAPSRLDLLLLAGPLGGPYIHTGRGGSLCHSLRLLYIFEQALTHRLQPYNGPKLRLILVTNVL